MFFGLSLRKMERRNYPADGNRETRRGWHACGARNAITRCGGLLAVILLAACDVVWNAPEGQARDFIQTLVTTPADNQQLHELANIPADRNPEDLLDGLSTRVAVDYLRARQAQGASLDFGRGEVQRTDASRLVVGVRVTYAPPGSATNSEVRFQVHMEKDDQGRWRIARVTGGD
jgi:hypothetical protein